MKRKLCVVDCETDPFKFGRVPEPFVWGYYDGREYKQFPPVPRKNMERVTDEFISFLSQQYVVCFAHNGGKYDWHFLLPYVNEYDTVMIINGRLAQFHIGLCECRDSYNILPVALAQYKKDEIDYDKFEKGEREKAHNWREISAYLKNDCVYLYELVSRFVKEFGLQLTQAGAAMNQWKRMSGANIPRTDKRFYEVFQPYYYGGRVECFDSGMIDGTFKVYDINSAYPYAMLRDHPYTKEYRHAHSFIPQADFYTVRCISHGAFPFRGLGGESDKNFGLHFPNDHVVRDYTVTGWEYQAALDTGTIENNKVLESYRFIGRVDFRKYVDHFWTKRQAARASGDDAGTLLFKLLMNSLYGKFGSNPAAYRNHMVVPMDVIAGLKQLGWYMSGELGPWALAEAPLTEEQMRYYNVATAASITGFVRAMLLRAIATSRGVIYCDTDSVTCRSPGKGIVLGDKLGEWKHEGTYDKVGIGGKKLYAMRSVPDAKGKRHYKMASKGARLTPQQIFSVARGGSVDYQPMEPTFAVRKPPAFTVRHIKNTA